MLNCAPNKTTGRSPFELLYWYTPRFEEGILRSLTEENEVYVEPIKLQDEAREKIAKNQEDFINGGMIRRGRAM